MRRLVAWPLMHVCYWTGEAAFQVLNRWPECKDGSLGDRLGSVVYKVYSIGMCWSCDLNDWGDFKFWYKADENRE
jgi:hypothetical protein